jgi:hypothetical protein
MGLSQSTITVSNMDIGPAQVLFNGVDLGGTGGNVKIKFKYDKAPIKADQTGKTTLDMAISGMECTVTTEFQETRNKTNFQLLFPSTVVTMTSGHQYIQFADQTAIRQLPLAAPLQLHPLEESLSGNDYDWYFYKAIPMEDSEYTFGPAEQAKLKVNWTILLDLTVTPGRLFRVGNHAL